MVIKYHSIRVGEGGGRAPLITLAQTEARLAQCFARCSAAPQLQVLHILGHAWLLHGRLYTAVNGRQTPLLELLAERIDTSPVAYLLLIDVCHAGALASELVDLRLSNAVVLMACAADERTEEYALEQATRLSLNLAGMMSVQGPIHSYELIAQFRKAPTDAIESRLHPQAWSIGSGFDLARQGVALPKRLRNTAGLLKSLFATAGALALFAAAATSYWWWKTSWVQVDVAAIADFGQGWSYEVTRWDIDRNGRSIVRQGVLPGRSLRADLPPGSYSLRLHADYADQAPRTLVWPLILRGALLPQAKTIQLRLPSLTSLQRASGMAWISADAPVAVGRDGELIDAPKPYWIDVFPVRAREVWGTAADAQLRDVNAVENALEHVPAGNLPELVDNMKDIMAHLDAETENQRGMDPEQFPSVMLRATKTPCDDCPAPISKDDAVAWCAQRSGRLPTPEEWQLAASGLDGRQYPWGNRFDRAYANIVGLPNRGEVMALTPVDQYPQGTSPYGVWDTVGNSGEWVDDGDLTGSKQAGGGYWNDRDGATVSAIDPVSDAWPYEVGVRCVLDVEAWPIEIQ